MAGEVQSARPAIHTKHRDVVASLVARVKELAAGIEIEAARIISTCPFIGDEGQFTTLANREYSDAVMQSIAGINKPAITRYHDFRAKVTAGKVSRQAVDRMTRGQPSLCGVVIEQNNVRSFLLEGVTPVSVGVKGEMPRPIARRKRNAGRIVGSQNTAAFVKLPDENPIQSQIRVQHEAS